MWRPGWIFRLVYSSFYLILYILLLALLVVTPADAIQRSIANNQRYNIWILVIVYVATVVVVSFIYVVRLYINKTALAAIPRGWIPIDIGDLPKPVYRIVVRGLSRSAAIAYNARPRVERELAWREKEEEQARAAESRDESKETWATQLSPEALGISVALQKAIWSDIEHYGWASPTSPDLANLQYSTVLAELPNLIEAKALALAPPDMASKGMATATAPPPPDPEALELLQRPPNVGLRGYLTHLTALGVLEEPEPEAGAGDGDGGGEVGTPIAAQFLQAYERARFSTRPMSNAQFRELMHLFAEVLRGMQPLDLDALGSSSSSSYYVGRDGDNGDHGSVLAPSLGDSYSEAYDDAYEAAHDADQSATPRSNMSRSATMSTQNSVRRLPVPRSSSWANYRTAPNTPNTNLAVTRQTSASSSGSSGVNAFAQTRQPFRAATPSLDSGSEGSIRSRSLRSHGSSSVIRLATREDDEDRPYVLNLRSTMDSWGNTARTQD